MKLAIRPSRQRRRLSSNARATDQQRHSPQPQAYPSRPIRQQRECDAKVRENNDQNKFKRYRIKNYFIETIKDNNGLLISKSDNFKSDNIKKNMKELWGNDTLIVKVKPYTSTNKHTFATHRSSSKEPIFGLYQYERKVAFQPEDRLKKVYKLDTTKSFGDYLTNKAKNAPAGKRPKTKAKHTSAGKRPKTKGKNTSVYEHLKNKTKHTSVGEQMEYKTNNTSEGDIYEIFN